MLDRNLKIVEDASAGEWIGPRLRGEFGAATLTVPAGYAAYARICHSATDQTGSRVSWPEVATATGRVAHPLMQWHALVGSSDPLNFKGSVWSGGDPDRGNLDSEQLATLKELLGKYTARAAQCYFGVWNGWDWGGPDTQPIHPTAGATCTPLKLPNREYLLFAGPLSAAGRFGFSEKWNFAQSPNLLWPSDHTWFVASEIDFDSTLVAGTETLISDILAEQRLDAWPIHPSDSLAFDADHINCTD